MYTNTPPQTYPHIDYFLHLNLQTDIMYAQTYIELYTNIIQVHRRIVLSQTHPQTNTSHTHKTHTTRQLTTGTLVFFPLHQILAFSLALATAYTRLSSLPSLSLSHSSPLYTTFYTLKSGEKINRN